MPRGIYIRKEETKRKIGISNSIARIGMKFSDSHKANLSIARRKRVITDETRNKTSESMKKVDKSKWIKAGQIAIKKWRDNLIREKKQIYIDKVSKSQKDRWAKISKNDRVIILSKWIKAGSKNWNNVGKQERLTRTKNWQTAGSIAAQKVHSSSIEKLVCKVLDSLNINYKVQVKFNNWFVDIYIPSKNLVIECNGTYWHNYKIFPEKKIRDDNLQDYCNNNSIKLLWLWEDEIRDNCYNKVLENVV